MIMQNMFTGEIESLFRKLPINRISHAEIEYLWDENPSNRGFIDPNALSAGGFPWLFRSILEYIQLDENAVVGKQSYASILTAVNSAFPFLSSDEKVNVAKTIDSQLRSMGITSQKEGEEFLAKFSVKAQELSSSVGSDFVKKVSALFSKPYGISWVYPALWKNYRMNKVKEFIRLAEQNRSIGPFSASVVQQVYSYLQSFYTTLGEITVLEYATYDVEWESDVSYYVATMLEQKGISTSVWIDLHSNTGAFAQIPLESIVAPYSSLYKAMYQILVNPTNKSITDTDCRISNDKISLHVSDEDKSIQFKGKSYDLQGYVATVSETLVSDFKQYAYLFEHIPRERLQHVFNSEALQKMYLSNLFNAKSFFFELLETNQDKGLTIEYPKTVVCGNNSDPETVKRYFSASDSVFIKEGGWCSTGGKEAQRVERDLIADTLRRSSYIGNVVQSYVQSAYFSQNDTVWHGHIRKLSVIKRNGEITHAGYLFKLNSIEKGNSSGYKTQILYFDEEGSFVFGKYAGSNTLPYTSLSAVGMVPLVDLTTVFPLVKAEWLKAMYLLNRVCADSHHLYGIVEKLVEDGKISQRYLIK